MSNVRVARNGAEKVARVVTDANLDPKHFSMDSEENIKMSIVREDLAKLDQAAADEIAKFEEHTKELEEVAKKFAENTDRVQIKPMFNYVIVKPFATNPFQQIKRSKSGIITDLGGMTPTFKSNDTGDYEEEEQFIRQGSVVEVGPEVKYLQIGDVIMWSKNSEIMIPFYRAGLIQVNEQRAICVINDNLNERFNGK